MRAGAAGFAPAQLRAPHGNGAGSAAPLTPRLAAGTSKVRRFSGENCGVSLGGSGKLEVSELDWSLGRAGFC